MPYRFPLFGLRLVALPCPPSDNRVTVRGARDGPVRIEHCGRRVQYEYQYCMGIRTESHRRAALHWTAQAAATYLSQVAENRYISRYL